MPLLTNISTRVRQLALVAVLGACLLGTFGLADRADAYTTSSNWYSKSWFLNRGETQQWAQATPGVVLGSGWAAGLPLPVKAGIWAYWSSFNWVAKYAYGHGRCLRITWIYVNLPYADQWWGGGC